MATLWAREDRELAEKRAANPGSASNEDAGSTQNV
jgi:hypothetical protein